jgi:uncharacterized protein YceK
MEKVMKKFRNIVVITLVMGLLVLSGCGGTSTTEKSTESSPQGESQAPAEQVLFEDENVKVTFVEIYEEPSLPNNCFLRLKVENKSDKTVTVSLKDSYVNGTAQMIGSGVPMELAPGKNSQTPFFFGYGNLGISSKDEIEKIEFKVWLMDEGFDTMIETDSLVIEFDK